MRISPVGPSSDNHLPGFRNVETGTTQSGIVPIFRHSPPGPGVASHMDTPQIELHHPHRCPRIFPDPGLCFNHQIGIVRAPAPDHGHGNNRLLFLNRDCPIRVNIQFRAVWKNPDGRSGTAKVNGYVGIAEGCPIGVGLRLENLSDLRSFPGSEFKDLTFLFRVLSRFPRGILRDPPPPAATFGMWSRVKRDLDNLFLFLFS